MNRIAQALCFPPVTCGAFNRYANYLYNRMDEHYGNSMKIVIAGLFRHYASIGEHPDPVTNYLDIAVTFDRTWTKWGHTSHIGVGFIIDAEIGSAINFKVLCNTCGVCNSKEESIPSQEEMDTWMERHKVRCHKNYDGKSDAMEAEAAKRMWQRSTKYNL